MESLKEFRRRLAMFILPAEDRNLLVYDSLTSVYNRGFWNKNLDETMQSIKDSNGRLDEEYVILFMVDVDNFKKINDSFGHTKGDLTLKNVAAGLMTAVRHGQIGRGSDVVARYGGDEFSILAMDKYPPNAGIIGQRLKDHQASPVSFGAICISVREICENGFIGDDLVQIADKLLYEAKAAGRNCGIVQTGFKNPTKQKILPTQQDNKLQATAQAAI